LCCLLPSPLPSLPGGVVPWFVDLFVIDGDRWLFYVFPRRIFGKASFFHRKRVFFTMMIDHSTPEKGRN